MPMTFRRRLYEGTSGFLGDMTLRTLVDVDKRNSNLDVFRDNQEKEKKPTYEGVGENELLLGWLDRDHDKPVTMYYDGKSFAAAILAQKGDGKTQLFKNLMVQLHDRFGYKVILMDPKNDYSNLDQPQRVPEYIQQLNRINFQPRGYNVVYLKPAFCMLDGRPGKECIVTPDMLNSLDYGKKMEGVREFFNELKDPAINRELDFIMSSVSGGSKVVKMPKTIKEWLHKHEEYVRNILAVRKKSNVGSKAMSSKFIQTFEDYINRGLFGDNAQKLITSVDEEGNPNYKSVFDFNIPKELMRTDMDGIVVVEQDLEGENLYMSSCYTKLIIASIWSDKKIYEESGGTMGHIAPHVLVGIDESDVLVPREKNRNSPSRSQCLQLQKRGRQLGFSLITISQQPDQVSEQLLTNMDLIFTSKLKSEKMRKLLKEKYSLADYQIEELNNLEYNRQKKPVQWAVLTGDTDEPYKLFYPLPPTIQIKEEHT